jgi:hypothetical protein
MTSGCVCGCVSTNVSHLCVTDTILDSQNIKLKNEACFLQHIEYFTFKYMTVIKATFQKCWLNLLIPISESGIHDWTNFLFPVPGWS